MSAARTTSFRSGSSDSPSGQRWFCPGGAGTQEDSEALGFPFPPLGVRFELLEDTLRIAHGMWSGERGSEEDFQGRRYGATRLLNSPQAISRPPLQRLRRAGEDPPQVRGPAATLRGRRPAVRGDRALEPPVGQRYARRWRRNRA